MQIHVLLLYVIRFLARCEPKFLTVYLIIRASLREIPSCIKHLTHRSLGFRGRRRPSAAREDRVLGAKGAVGILAVGTLAGLWNTQIGVTLDGRGSPQELFHSSVTGGS